MYCVAMSHKRSSIHFAYTDKVSLEKIYIYYEYDTIMDTISTLIVQYDIEYANIP